MTATVANPVTVAYLDPGTWSAVFGLSYRDLLLYDLATDARILRKGGVELRALTGSGGIPASRNKCVADFLKSDSEWLWFVDSDMGFAPDTVDRLVESADPDERPIMGALCFQQKRCGAGDFGAVRYRIQTTLLEWLEIEDTGERGFRAIEDYKRDAVVPVSATGSACILVHRRVYEDISDKHGAGTWYDLISMPGAGGKGRSRTFSEDLSFCIRAAAVGASVHVNTSVKTTHDKDGIYLDEEMYDAFRVPHVQGKPGEGFGIGEQDARS